jgi:hypothetical protein
MAVTVGRDRFIYGERGRALKTVAVAVNGQRPTGSANGKRYRQTVNAKRCRQTLPRPKTGIESESPSTRFTWAGPLAQLVRAADS